MFEVLPESYWERAIQTMAEALTPELERIAVLGAEDGLAMVAGAVPKGSPGPNYLKLHHQGAMIATSSYSEKVLEGYIAQAIRTWAWGRAWDLARQIITTTRKWVEEKLSNWLGLPKEERASLQELEEEIGEVLGEGRIEAIVITELTNAYTAGELASWYGDERVVGKVWRTAEDERVCEWCGPLEGMVLELHGGFTTEGDDVGPLAPPIHVRCRCWLSPVLLGDVI